MEPTLSSATAVTGFILGWSVAWPPGPVNAEIIRRCVLPEARGGGFWSALKLGIGACAGDFVWALGVSAGAGALINTPSVRVALGIVSCALLLFLAITFARGAWRTYREQRADATALLPADSTAANRPPPSRSFLLGFTFAITSPWSMGFWLAVVGSQTGMMRGTFSHSLLLAASVVLGAFAWTLVLAVGVKLGARIFSRPGWQVATQVLTAVVMLYFAARLVLQLT